MGNRGRADVQRPPLGRHFVDAHDLATRRRRRRPSATTQVHRQFDLAGACLHQLAWPSPAPRPRPGSCPCRSPGRRGRCWPCRRRSGSRRPWSSRIRSRRSCRRSWRRPGWRRTGARGFSRAPPRYSSSFSIRKPATAGRIVGHALGAGVGAVGAAKGIVDVDVAQPGQAARPWPGSFLVSRLSKRVFSSTSTSPGLSAAAAASASGPTVGADELHRRADQRRPGGRPSPSCCTWGPGHPWGGPGGSSGSRPRRGRAGT